MSPDFDLWEKSLKHPGLSYFAVNGENILNAPYSASEHPLNSGADVCLVDSKIFFMIGTRGTSSSRKQKDVQIREGAGSNTLRTAGLLSPARKGEISEKEPGAAEWWALSDYEMMSGMDENYQAK